jgi:hypothetical protein
VQVRGKVCLFGFYKGGQSTKNHDPTPFVLSTCPILCPTIW